MKGQDESRLSANRTTPPGHPGSSRRTFMARASRSPIGDGSMRYEPCVLPPVPNASGAPNPLVRQHKRNRALRDNDDARRTAYHPLVAPSVNAAEVEHIRATLKRQHALGNDRFRELSSTSQDGTQDGRMAGRPSLGRQRKVALSLLPRTSASI